MIQESIIFLTDFVLSSVNCILFSNNTSGKSQCFWISFTTAERIFREKQKTLFTINRTYKSTVFIMLFEDKKNLLELYNAISGKHYTNPELLEITTLENAIYMSIKNDVSFLIDGRLSLYEHQSTYNPNLPLRFLLYIANQYSEITRNANLYGSKIIKIPTPEFIIFYNGKKDCPDRQVMRISDMYTVKMESYKLELEATMLNINGTHNQKLKDACQTLNEYAIYTDKIRRYTEKMSLESAVEQAIHECIEENVLKEFLEKHRTEVKAMSIFEYDQEKHLRMEREDGRKEGWESGLREGEKNTIGKFTSLFSFRQLMICIHLKSKIHGYNICFLIIYKSQPTTITSF